VGNTLGLLELPVVAGYGGTEAPGDRALTAIGKYLQAGLVHYLDAAWKAATLGTGMGATKLAKGQSIVKSVSYNDPEDNTFNVEQLPALFVFRDWDAGVTHEWVADDFICQKSTIRVLWCPSPSPQTFRSGHESFCDAINKVVGLLMAQGRDPSWVATGETDADYLIYGTPLMAAAGAHRQPYLMAAKRIPIKIAMVDGSEGRTYPAMLFTIHLTEVNDWDLTVGGSISQGTSEVVQAQDPGGHRVELALYPPVLTEDGQVLTDEDGYPLDLA